MTEPLGNFAGYPGQATRPNMRRGHCKIYIGSSGAVTAATSDLPAGFTVAKNTTGVYDVTFPPCPKMVFMGSVLYSASNTVGHVIGTADVDLSNGTWQFKTTADATATPVEPASGNVLVLWFDAQWMSVS